MARTPDYWYNIMIAEKNTKATLNIYQPNVDSSQTFLNDLTTKSKVASWRCMLWVVATCAFAFDVVFDLFKIFIAELVAKSRYGTLPWYNAIAKEYQHGDTLVQIDYEWKYATVNDTLQIVKLSAAKDGPGIVNLKVAKLVADVPTKLSTPEFDAFVGYIGLKKPAGIVVHVISDDPDELRLYLAVNYDPTVLTATGELISTPGTYPVDDAVNAYLKSLDFDGRMELMKLIDSVQAATGVKSAYVTNAEARYGTNPFVAFAQSYYPNAGHMVIDPATPLSGTVTYSAYV